MPSTYLTTPIYYVNDVPHIGHAYCTLATDTLARFYRMTQGADQVCFVTGTDENSQKTVDAATMRGTEIYTYLEDMAGNWRSTWETIGISFDDFIRTTEDRHIQTVENLLKRIYDKGDIYEGLYKGLYCSGCETFKKESDLDEKGHCPDHKKAPEALEEANYFFRLSDYQDRLLEYFEAHPFFLQPASRRNEILSFIKEGLDDISISRESAEFGIPLPMNPDHKIYVWFDALINYISVLSGREADPFWEGEVTHIVGKDITRFHCVIWPAMLMSAGIKLPEKVFAHGFFTVEGVKMSKSLGNVISPVELSEKYGNDALRCGLLGSFEFGGDGDFSRAQFDKFYETKLAGGVGNLFNRVVILMHKFMEGAKFAPEASEAIDQRQAEFESLMDAKKIKAAIDFYFGVVDQANVLLNETEVWKLAKTDLEAAKKVFQSLQRSLEFLAINAEVLLPESAPQMQAMLGEEDRLGEACILFAKPE